MKILYTFLIGGMAILSQACAQSQGIDTTIFKSAKDYIRHKEATDPNMNGLKPKKIIQLKSPVKLYADSTPVKNNKKVRTAKRKARVEHS